MNADLPIDTGPAPRRRFTIRSMMLAVIAIGFLIGWGLGLERASRRVGQATTELYALVGRIERDDPSVSSIVINGEGQFRLDGAGSTVRSLLKTATGAEVAITIDVRSRVFRGESGQVVFEAGGRSVTWPFDDLRRGRKLDLRAMFPEAF
jgi:hypothetical protein